MCAQRGETERRDGKKKGTLLYFMYVFSSLFLFLSLFLSHSLSPYFVIRTPGAPHPHATTTTTTLQPHPIPSSVCCTAVNRPVASVRAADIFHNGRRSQSRRGALHTRSSFSSSSSATPGVRRYELLHHLRRHPSQFLRREIKQRRQRTSVRQSRRRVS